MFLNPRLVFAGDFDAPRRLGDEFETRFSNCRNFTFQR
ncbi:hypothetical protein MTBUT4_300019 [Magnetospirillum sp. UT-4]|nr:hypothetical protein MTBUT4_300019 [Magnetospirillum sp. UT-4]